MEVHVEDCFVELKVLVHPRGGEARVMCAHVFSAGLRYIDRTLCALAKSGIARAGR